MTCRSRAAATRLHRVVLLAALAAGTAPAASAPRAAAAPVPDAVSPAARELREVFSPDGTIARVWVPVAAPSPERELRAAAAAAGDVHRYDVRGGSGSKLDLVVVGDGYTDEEQELFRRDAQRNIQLLFSIEPYRAYRDLFNVWLVEVESRESGIDNDPTPGVSRDTALDAGFWCAGTERLICVDQDKALAAASAAPAVDQALVVTNTSKYGGSGGEVATVAGANPLAGQILQHELGHSLGALTDEYMAASPLHTHPGEPPERNASHLPAAVMSRLQAKWHRWLGRPTPDGGVIGTYVGSRYSPAIFRPSENSLMRELNREFNVVSREAMVLAFYDRASPLSDASPAAERVPRSATLTVRPAQPRGQRLVVSWSVDGAVVASGTRRLDLQRVGLRGPGPHEVTVTVTDPTPWVLGGPERASLTATRTWTTH